MKKRLIVLFILIGIFLAVISFYIRPSFKGSVVLVEESGRTTSRSQTSLWGPSCPPSGVWCGSGPNHDWACNDGALTDCGNDPNGCVFTEQGIACCQNIDPNCYPRQII